jgi:hypothetical protein
VKSTSVVATLVAVSAAILPARASASSCGADAAERAASIRARLDVERGKASTWRWGWAAGFGALSGAQLTLALTETAPTGDFDEPVEASLYVGAAKSGIGMLARIVKPIKVPRPSETGDACADLAAAERALAITARSEKISFWLNHAGGLALQIGGTLYIGLAVEDAWTDAAISFGLGFTVGAISTYTQPRTIWKQERARMREGAVTWQLTPLLTPRAHGVGVVGTF